jgi:hypothetical protein
VGFWLSERHEEIYEFGRFSSLPAFDHPAFYETGTTVDGTVTVGPLDLTAAQIKAWSEQATCEEVNQLVQQGRLRPHTPTVISSDQFKSVLDWT